MMINNTEAFKKFDVRTDYSYEDMAEIIDKSIRIDDEYKEIIKDFCKTMLITLRLACCFAPARAATSVARVPHGRAAVVRR